MAAVTPIAAATILPPTIDQGCASGLFGMPNSSTAEAPIGATNHKLACPNSQWLIRLVMVRPSPAPTLAITISFLATGSGCGQKRAKKVRSALLPFA